jgi:hypothetical protein
MVNNGKKIWGMKIVSKPHARQNAGRRTVRTWDLIQGSIKNYVLTIG